MIRSNLLTTAKDSIWYGAATLAAQIAPLILLPFYVRWFSSDGLGVIQGVMAFAYFWYVVMALQMCSVSMRFYYEYKAKQQLEELVGSLLTILLISTLVLGSLACFLAPAISKYLFDQSGYHNTIVLAVVSTCLWVIGDYLFTLLRLETATKTYFAINILKLGSIVTLNYVCVRNLSLGINGVFYAYLISQLLTLSVLVIQSRISIKPNFRTDIFKRIFYYVRPLMLVPVLEWFRNYYYQVYTLRHIGESDLGVLSVSIRVVQVFILIDSGLNLAWTPIAMSVIGHPRGKQLYLYYYRYSFIVYFMLFAFLSLFSKEGIALFANGQYSEAFRYVPILFLIPFTKSLAGHYSNGIEITEKTVYLSYSYGLGALASVLSIHICAMWFGQIGVLIGAAFGSFIIAITSLIFSERIYPVGYPLKPVMCFFAFALLLILYNTKFAVVAIAPFEIIGKLCFILSLSFLLYRWWLNKKERYEIRLLVKGKLIPFKVAAYSRHGASHES